MEKPTLPKGTRDFGPAMMARRQYIIGVIKKVFEKYGFQQLETPAMENLSTLTGKYGEEGDQLLFRILDSGDFTKLLKSKLLESNQDRLIDYLNLVREKIANVYKVSHSKSEDLREIKKTWRTQRLFVFSGATELSQDEEQALDEFLNSDFITDLICQEIEREFFKIKGLVDPDLDWHFKQFEKEFINKLVADILRNHIVANNVKNISAQESVRFVAEKGLKYDLTVPFARYVVMNRHEVTIPFKRFQIQPVWRADRPQKGRYREFYQCDADVIGTDSLICEAEIVLMIREVMSGLGIEDFTVKVNHRGILSGLAELAEARENESALFVAIDKLDKVGEEKVKEELTSRGFSPASIQTIFQILNFKGSNLEKIDFLNTKLGKTEKGSKGTHDMMTLIEILSKFDLPADSFELDIALARGLSYYTGGIFEVKINNVAIGSVSGGGRYDDLTGVFGSKEKLSGVGISFGLDRIYDAMEELNLFPPETEVSSEVLIAHLDEKAMSYGFTALKELRKDGVSAEIYPDVTKLKKQLDYANKKKIPYVVVIGEDEMKSGKLSFRNMNTGDQQSLTLDEILIQF
ncbi:MAG: histidine--tRNA ligase [Cyclobacteriaceae bacterium]